MEINTALCYYSNLFLTSLVIRNRNIYKQSDLFPFVSLDHYKLNELLPKSAYNVLDS